MSVLPLSSMLIDLDCDNIYLSDSDGPSPLVQVGGLGNCMNLRSY